MTNFITGNIGISLEHSMSSLNTGWVRTYSSTTAGHELPTLFPIDEHLLLARAWSVTEVLNTQCKVLQTVSNHLHLIILTVELGFRQDTSIYSSFAHHTCIYTRCTCSDVWVEWIWWRSFPKALKLGRSFPTNNVGNNRRNFWKTGQCWSNFLWRNYMTDGNLVQHWN